MSCPTTGISEQENSQAITNLQKSQAVQSLRASAENALSRDFSILALAPNSKTPLFEYSPHGVNSASTNPEIALLPYDDGIPANYGVACGKSNLAVIDVDHGISSEEELNSWMERNSLPKTFTVRTGRDGFGAHLYYSSAVPSKSFYLDGVRGEIKSIGSYVVAPGSFHETGRKYEIIHDIPSVALPEFLKDLSKPRDEAKGVSSLVPETERNGWQTSLFGYLVNFKGGSLPKDALEAMVRAATPICCEDGKAYVEEHDRKLGKQADYAKKNFTVNPAMLPKRKGHSQLMEEMKTSSSLTPIVDGLIFRKTVNIAVGNSGLGKTPLLLQLALCVAFGLDFIGQKCERGRVLITDYENPNIAEMLSVIAGHLGIATPIDEKWLAILQNADKETVFREIDDFRPRLVIVDSLRGFDSSAEGESKNAADLISSCQKRAEQYESAWMFIHHLRKQNKNLKPEERPNLFDTEVPVINWFEESAGYLALINQTHTRIGFAKPKHDNSEFGLRGYVKTKGNVGPWLLEREYDQGGDPVGYSRLRGIDLLSEEYKKFVCRIPLNEPQSHQQILQSIFDGNKSKKPALGKFLASAIDAGVIVTHGKAHTTSKAYTRVAEAA